MTERDTLSPLVRLVSADDDEGKADLYRLLRKHFAAWLSRNSTHGEEQLHDTFLEITEAIRAGRLRNPESLIRYAAVILRRKAATCRRPEQELTAAVELAADERLSPESLLLEQERMSRVRAALLKLRPIDRELIRRFYVDVQTQERICAELNLTEAQFRNRKSRAKAKLVAAIASADARWDREHRRKSGPTVRGPYFCCSQNPL